jgi:Rrf2 family nitric oxide-sensitive transcriptional repressor
MKLTRYTDYALRVLMHLAAAPERLASIAEIAAAHRVSENHLMKVVQDLGRAGYLRNVRGRGGGVKLARRADDITVGEVVRQTEGDRGLLDCEGCALAARCRLTGVLAAAKRAFYATLDGCTIADIAASAADAIVRGAASAETL